MFSIFKINRIGNHLLATEGSFLNLVPCLIGILLNMQMVDAKQRSASGSDCQVSDQKDL